MKKDDLLKSVGNTISFIAFVKYGFPLLIVFILILLIAQGGYGSTVEQKYRYNGNVILSSKLLKTVYDYADELYDKSAFSKIEDPHCNYEIVSTYTVQINYYFSGNDRTAEEYDALVKEELTKLYSKLKGKVIENDQIFGKNDDKSIGLCFFIPNKNGVESYITSISLLYKKDTGFDEEAYQKEISKEIVTEEKLQKVLDEI